MNNEERHFAAYNVENSSEEDERSERVACEICLWEEVKEGQEDGLCHFCSDIKNAIEDFIGDPYNHHCPSIKVKVDPWRETVRLIDMDDIAKYFEEKYGITITCNCSYTIKGREIDLKSINIHHPGYSPNIKGLR